MNEAGTREVSGRNASECIEPRNDYSVGGRLRYSWRKAEFSASGMARCENPTGSEAAARYYRELI